MSGLQLWTRKEIFIFSIAAKLIHSYKIKTKPQQQQTETTNKTNKRKTTKKTPTKIKTPPNTPCLLK